MLFQTIPNCDYSTLDDRVWEYPGAIVDLGCRPWDWSMPFIGRKRVVGVDPFASEILGAELFKGVLGATHGSARIARQGDEATLLIESADSESVAKLTWKEFKEIYRIGEIAALKMNIEGAEYELLSSMDNADFCQIDQILVSFHHWRWPEFNEATIDLTTRLVKVGYAMTRTNQKWAWWLGVKIR